MLSKEPTTAATREQLWVECTNFFTTAAACLLISSSRELHHASISTKRSMAPEDTPTPRVYHYHNFEITIINPSQAFLVEWLYNKLFDQIGF